MHVIFFKDDGISFLLLELNFKHASVSSHLALVER